jgi:tRNA uridine 5-carboxymethylaminomethyl modification enzyme
MFTSRAEYRLLLDIESADLRLTRHGHRIGLIPEARYQRFLQRERRVNAYRKVLEESDITPRAEVVERGRELLGITLTGATTPAILLRRGDVSIASIDRFLGDAVPQGVTARERRYVADRLRYGGYIERQERERARLQRAEERRIPADFDFAALPGLSREVIEKLSAIRPESIARAARISGVTPAALSLLVIYLERARRQRITSGTPAEHRRRRIDSRSNEAPAAP